MKFHTFFLVEAFDFAIGSFADGLPFAAGFLTDAFFAATLAFAAAVVPVTAYETRVRSKR